MICRLCPAVCVGFQKVDKVLCFHEVMIVQYCSFNIVPRKFLHGDPQTRGCVMQTASKPNIGLY